MGTAGCVYAAIRERLRPAEGRKSHERCQAREASSVEGRADSYLPEIAQPPQLSKPLVIVAGATGHVGRRIARILRERDVPVRAIVRPGAGGDRLAELNGSGVEIAEASYDNSDALRRACRGGSCLVSALNGLREVIVDAQTALLQAALAASVPRFIPSDFAIDFMRLPEGSNRNLDLRREFRRRLDAAPIQATSILNGMFMDLLAGQAPFIIFKLHRVVYWDNADQPMDFTTIDDTAAFTASAATDDRTPRDLRIAGDTLTARGLAQAASDATGSEFSVFRAGPLSRLEKLIRLTRLVSSEDEVFPPWQGMQYMHNMYSGLARLAPLDNDRYPMRWTRVQEVLAAHVAGAKTA